MGASDAVYQTEAVTCASRAEGRKEPRPFLKPVLPTASHYEYLYNKRNAVSCAPNHTATGGLPRGVGIGGRGMHLTPGVLYWLAQGLRRGIRRKVKREERLGRPVGAMAIARDRDGGPRGLGDTFVKESFPWGWGQRGDGWNNEPSFEQRS